MAPAAIQSLLRKTPTLAPVLNRALVSVSGSDADVFLNGILSTHVRPPQHSAFLHAQGRVLYDVLIYTDPTSRSQKGPSYVIEYSPPPPSAEDVPPLLSYLKRHVLRSKVKVRDVSQEYDIWSAWGCEKEKIWETRRNWTLARSGAAEQAWRLEEEADGWPWSSTPGILRDRRAVGMGERLLVPSGERPRETSTHDVQPADAYLLHRILHGVPEGNIDIPPLQAFPIESNFDLMGAVDFRKGCYVGQELTVRTYHTGTVRKRIHPVIIQGSGASSSNCPTILPEPLSPHLDVKPIKLAEDTHDGERRPRPRGTGKLLSTTVHGVGLALLRLEHVAGVNNGSIKLEVAQTEPENRFSILPWIPEWWPRRPLEQNVEDVPVEEP